jgi:hypothetical protein
MSIPDGGAWLALASVGILWMVIWVVAYQDPWTVLVVGRIIVAIMATIVLGYYLLRLNTTSEKSDNIVFSYIKAKKQRICPMIKFE